MTDTGAGMDTETKAKCTVPFFTTKEDHRGLGLATALGVMHAHRGALMLESSPDTGTSVRALFPTA